MKNIVLFAHGTHENRGCEAIVRGTAGLLHDEFENANISVGSYNKERDEKVISFECIENVYDELIKLDKDGLIKLYLYPNRPSFVPLNNSDLIPKVLRWYKNGFNINKFYDIYPELKDTN